MPDIFTAQIQPHTYLLQMIARTMNFQTRRNLLETNQDVCMNSSCDSFIINTRFYLEYLNLYYVPVIVVVGVVGNFLSFLVLLTTHLKVRSSSYYLAALAVTDSGYLACILLVYCSSNGVVDWFHQDGFCQLWVYLTYVCSFLSVWFIVAFTVERFIAVRYPLRKPYVCTVSRAKMIVLSLTCVAFLLHSYVFWIASVVDQRCHLNPDYVDLAEYVNYVDTIVTFLVPVVLIVGMNALIARSLLRFRKNTQRGVLGGIVMLSENCALYEMNNSQSTSSTKKSKETHSSPDLNVERLKKITVKNIHSRRNSRMSKHNE
ncbi:unnamed protein product [Phaedon cochleariae]|uniref:G-protein coupled receptors family 1 profile domain-containing protein n=1 Tax=Phaedon cochleariae TaxID=80249 RepID=A0A9N9X593_PHACE|nr:unnamed protein product [Phaedon cochleariae]